MIESILRRYPELSKSDVSLRNDGNGIYIEVWNCDQSQPTIEEVNQWVEEDVNLPQPLSEMDQLKKQQELMQEAIDELIFGGSL